MIFIGFVVLLEYIFISTGMYIAFSAEIMLSPYLIGRDDSQLYSPLQMSFCSFVWKILQFQDIFVSMVATDGDRPIIANAVGTSPKV